MGLTHHIDAPHRPIGIVRGLEKSSYDRPLVATKIYSVPVSTTSLEIDASCAALWGLD